MSDTLTTEEIITHKPIKTEFVWTGDGLGTSNAVTLKQLRREHNVAIYRRTHKDGRVSWEVIKIKKHNGYILGGQIVAPAETYPGAAQWGINGFDAHTLKRAEEKFEELVEAAILREKADAESIARGEAPKRRGRPKKVV